MKNKPENIDQYIASFPDGVGRVLQELRRLIQKSAPDATQAIKYAMPAFELNGPLVYFAAFKNHIGFYATPTGHKAFQKELSVYKTGKGSVQFPLNQPMPADLIARIVKFRVQENMTKAAMKK